MAFKCSYYPWFSSFLLFPQTLMVIDSMNCIGVKIDLSVLINSCSKLATTVFSFQFLFFLFSHSLFSSSSAELGLNPLFEKSLPRSYWHLQENSTWQQVFYITWQIICTALTSSYNYFNYHPSFAEIIWHWMCMLLFAITNWTIMTSLRQVKAQPFP